MLNRVRKAEDEDEDFDFGFKPKRISCRQIPVRQFTIYITRAITQPDDFLEELEVLNNATEYDTVRMIIDTTGGYVSTANLLRKAIRECKGRVIGVIGMNCASAGSSIALACDSWEVDAMSTFMIHSPSYGTGFGKDHEIYNCALFNKQLNEDWFRDSYTGFLSESEIVECLKGSDKYFRAEDLAKRLENYVIYSEEKTTKKEEAPKKSSAKKPAKKVK